MMLCAQQEMLPLYFGIICCKAANSAVASFNFNIFPVDAYSGGKNNKQTFCRQQACFSLFEVQLQFNLVDLFSPFSSFPLPSPPLFFFLPHPPTLSSFSSLLQ